MIVVGEKLNATRKDVKELVLNRDRDGVAELARAQDTAGAYYIDVNVGTGTGTARDEVDAMDWAVRTVLEATEKAICVDSSDPAVLEAGLAAAEGRETMINSAKAGSDDLHTVVNLAVRFGSVLVGLAMDETGIPKSAEGRLDACAKIADACAKAGLPLERVYFDPLVMPVSTDSKQAMVTMNTIVGIKERFPGARTVMGLSNVSFGLPARSRVNTAFLHMSAFAGLDAAIADPLDKELMLAVKTAHVLLGKDRHCRKYLKAFRGR